jgi:hypothetical protein
MPNTSIAWLMNGRNASVSSSIDGGVARVVAEADHRHRQAELGEHILCARRLAKSKCASGR